MNRILLLFAILFASTSSLECQIYDPVDWNTSIQSLGDNRYELIFDAVMEEHWHVYSAYLDTNKIGPFPTMLTLDASDAYKTIGKLKEGTPVSKYDPNFGMELKYFDDQARFTQEIEWTSAQPGEVSGYISFMTCNEEMCLPPEDIMFRHKVSPASGEKSAPDEKSTGEALPEDGAVDEESSFFASESDLGGDSHSDGGIQDPVTWTWSSKALGNNEFEISLRAVMEEHWHVYSAYLDTTKIGPLPTEFHLDQSDSYSASGPLVEGEPVLEFDPNFDMELKFFNDEATFTQKVKWLGDKEPGVIQGLLSYMTCNESMCLFPPEVMVAVDLATGEMADYVTEGSGEVQDASTLGAKFILPNVDLDNPIIDCGEQIKKETNLWKILLLGFLGGLVALLTPCVFPMIPLTVSFFTKGSEDKRRGIQRAVTYGFFILLIYLLLSVPFHLLDGINPDILNSISTNIWLNLVFFVVFIVFALSFFGLFEITLPSSFTNKMDDKASSVGGLIGIFFMALTLALVSFSCTGPILGSLLAGSLTQDGGAMQLTAGFGGFGLALALPFALFAAFPGWMNSLPQSGGWLNSVKVVLGFVEVALAMKFLSNADLVAHWDFIKIEPFLIIWIICSIGLALYLFGLIKFPHDSPISKLSLFRKLLGVLAVAFTVYLISGFKYQEETHTFTPLKLLSGLAPPVGYSYIYPVDCPQSLPCFHDFDKGMAFAREQNKPVLLDFTGYACVNCRKMEEHVWPEDGVIEHLTDDYVLISLYVDDSEELPVEEQIEYKMRSGNVRRIRTVGNKWSTLQAETFINNSQPYYALLTPDGYLINNPKGYTPDVAEYQYFLECGLEGFKKYQEK